MQKYLSSTEEETICRRRLFDLPPLQLFPPPFDHSHLSFFSPFVFCPNLFLLLLLLSGQPPFPSPRVAALAKKEEGGGRKLLRLNSGGRKERGTITASCEIFLVRREPDGGRTEKRKHLTTIFLLWGRRKDMFQVWYLFQREKRRPSGLLCSLLTTWSTKNKLSTSCAFTHALL